MEEKQYFLEEVRRNKRFYQFLGDEWRADIDIARASIGTFGDTLAFAPLWMKSDRDIVMLAIRTNGLAIEFVHPDLANIDVEICRLAVEKDIDSFELLSPEMRMREDILLTLLRGYWGFSPFKKHVPDHLLAKKSFMKQVLSINGRMLEYAPPQIYLDPEIACIAARNCGRFAFKRLNECLELPEVMREFELMQEECEAKMDAYLLEQNPKKKGELWYEICHLESDFGIRSIRAESTAYSGDEDDSEVEQAGIRLFMLADDESTPKSVKPNGQDPMRIDAVFHSPDTGLGSFSYSLSQKLKADVHVNATLVSMPLIDQQSSETVRVQATNMMNDILSRCKQNNWHRIRLTNFIFLKSCQFEAFWGIALSVKAEEDRHALTIYMDIDPDYVKGNFGGQIDLLGPK